MQSKTQHLLWRAGFGANLQQLKRYQNKTIHEVVADLFQLSQTVQPLHKINQNFVARENLRGLNKDKVKALMKDSRMTVRKINATWIDQMANSEAQLREKMTLFWHGHFACQEKNAYFVQIQNNTLRQHALGNFGDLLLAIAQDPAMLKFLNNKQNKKASPNENFARELLELFTLGIGNYTETDIKEAARAFTGWSFDLEGNFALQKWQHDTDSKTFMGNTSNLDGTDIVRIILKNKQTARFITTKIYRYFVNETVNATASKRIENLANSFYASNYDISALLHQIFTADWFYAPENMGNRIKSPVELMVGLMRPFKVNFASIEAPLFVQRVLGQVLFDPPNVAGWKGGKSWIDSSTLTFRMSLPTVLFKNAATDISPKESLSMENVMGSSRQAKKKIQASFDAQHLYRHFSQFSGESLKNEMAAYFLQTDISRLNPLILNQFGKGQDKNTQMQNIAIALFSLPEYQLC